MEVQESILEIVRVVEMQASSQNTDIQINLPKKFIVADKQRIQQVSINLLSNAVKFTQDGTITVKAWFKEPKIKHRAMISHQIETDKSNKSNLDRIGRLYISVSDTGVGIPKDE